MLNMGNIVSMKESDNRTTPVKCNFKKKERNGRSSVCGIADMPSVADMLIRIRSNLPVGATCSRYLIRLAVATPQEGFAGTTLENNLDRFTIINCSCNMGLNYNLKIKLPRRNSTLVLRVKNSADGLSGVRQRFSPPEQLHRNSNRSYFLVV
jgi:hypothetical protein